MHTQRNSYKESWCTADLGWGKWVPDVDFVGTEQIGMEHVYGEVKEIEVRCQKTEVGGRKTEVGKAEVRSPREARGKLRSEVRN